MICWIVSRRSGCFRCCHSAETLKIQKMRRLNEMKRLNNLKERDFSCDALAQLWLSIAASKHHRSVTTVDEKREVAKLFNEPRFHKSGYGAGLGNCLWASIVRMTIEESIKVFHAFLRWHYPGSGSRVCSQPSHSSDEDLTAPLAMCFWTVCSISLVEFVRFWSMDQMIDCFIAKLTCLLPSSLGDRAAF